MKNIEDIIYITEHKTFYYWIEGNRIVFGFILMF